MNITIKKFTLGLALAAIAFGTKAQKKITEGSAVYTVSYELPADKQQYAAIMPKEIKCYFRGDSSATLINQGSAKIKSILNFKAKFQSLMIDVPQVDKKIVVVLTPADQKKLSDKEPDFSGAPTTDTETIAGYKCTKVNVKDSKSGTSYEMWVTKDLDFTANAMTKLLSKIGGVPVKFVTYNNGVKINAQLKEVKEEVVPPGFFTVTKDYEPISMDLLMQAFGGMQ
ncbi:MAG: DUF4412 domain-containing protein [Sphingobacteriaceae bacterium]